MNITERQIIESILAIFALIPAGFCTGYLAAWAIDLHGFRRRPIVERMFWSVPLSVALSPISSVLLGWFISLTTAAAFFVGSALLCVLILAREWFHSDRSMRGGSPGRQPLGGWVFALALLWTVVAILSLVDLQLDHGLYLDLATLDQCFRVSWTEAILRSGVPPVNPLYCYKHAANMRNYYFWYVVCAAAARMSHLPSRAILTASSVWAGFGIASLIFLYLKYFLEAGDRLRRQLTCGIALLGVTGLDIVVILWNVLYVHGRLTPDGEKWSSDPIISWLDTLLWAPHHIAGLICCMLAFLLAWISEPGQKRKTIGTVVLISLAMASAFGLSIYVSFAFLLVMLAWITWEIFIEKRIRTAMILAAGGTGSIFLLVPYLQELVKTSSGLDTGRAFAISIREMLPASGLLNLRAFQSLSLSQPSAAANVAKTLLLVPGYALELGFYSAVLIIYLIPAWRAQKVLTSAQRSLVFISLATLAVVTFIRSGALESNDFGWRGALLLQFALLLLGSEVLMSWNLDRRQEPLPGRGLPGNTPALMRVIASLALVLGVFSTLYQLIMFRCTFPLAEASFRAGHSPEAGKISNDAYISSVGYANLNAVIAENAIVQFNPRNPKAFSFWTDVDVLDVDHQMAIAGDQPWCGAEVGGDPRGCLPMAAAIDALYKDASAEQARATCSELGIQYLVTKIYDPPWKDKNSWVWTLPAVVSDPEFRALDCR